MEPDQTQAAAWRTAGGRRAIPAAIVWIACSLGGLAALAVVHTSPGDRGESPAYWPEDAPWPRSTGTSTIVMFAHPRCPCTRAALRELAVIRARIDLRCPIRVVFYRPIGATADWQTTAMVTQAEATRGLEISWDEGGKIAARFGARTSGHVFCYDDQGRLSFSGGITMARGHDGDNPGRAALVAAACNRRTTIGRTPVFGCSLVGPEAASEAASPTPLTVTVTAEATQP